MSIEYKFLILEDVVTDAELIMDQIRVADIVCDFECTDNEVDFKRLIDEFKPDLILSDYSLPAYDGMSALKYVLEHSPDIPVILVTGSINEETAVACMRTGAVDYVLKDKMSRLGLAVKTALENKDIKLERAKVREKLKKSELYYRFILKCMNDEIVVISRDLIITDINDSILRFIEGKREDIIGQPYYKVLHNFESPCFYNGVNCFLSKVIESGKPERYQRKLITQDGKKVHMDVMISPLYDQNNQISHVIESYRDITDQVKNLNEIKKLSIAVEQSPSSVIMMDKEGRIEYINPMFTKVTGYESQEVQGENIGIISSGSTSMEEREQVHQDVLNGNNRTFIFENRRKDGSSFSVEAYLAPFRGNDGVIIGVIEIMEDITQRLLDQKQIEDDLKEKEILLQEIYHRVNNNMQIMISLFNMQIERSELQAEKDVLTIAQTRVGAISAIHNDIYQERSFTAINFSNVISHIFSNLCHSLMVLCGNIELYVEADVPDFGLDLAQPSALIVSELMANCIRHAYPGGKGAVNVNMSIDESDEITLIVKDNGVGIPEYIVPEESETTGFNLVYMLATSQLGGTVEITRDSGTTVAIKFKRIEDKKRF